MARVSCYQEVVCDFNEGCFCTVSGAETGLELFVEVIGGEVGLNL